MCPTCGTIGASRLIMWIWVPSSSTQVYWRNVSGGSTCSNPSSSKKPTVASISAGGAPIPTWWSTAKNLQRWCGYVTYCLLQSRLGGSGRREGGGDDGMERRPARRSEQAGGQGLHAGARGIWPRQRQ